MWSPRLAAPPLFVLLKVVHVLGTAKMVEPPAEMAEAPADTVAAGIYQAMAQPYMDEDDTDISGLEWGEPISEAEKIRSRSVAGDEPSEETLKIVKQALESEGHRGKNGRAILRGIEFRWPNGQVPYRIENAFQPEDREQISAGMENIESNTCIKFVPATDADKAWVTIFTTGAQGCYAHTRYLGLREHIIGLEVNRDLNRTCAVKGIVVHELLHILGVAHEQQRPDRDNYLDMNWPNIDVNMAENMWRNAWETENVNALKRCSKQGVLQATADFSDCVSGDVVTDFGVGYDFKSVMHYGLYSFAVNRSIPVMIPKDGNITDRDVGGNELSAMDIKKLNFAYFCEDTSEVTCGGAFYSATGGNIKGGPAAGPSACEFLLRTDSGLGIELNLEETFGGNCTEDYLEIWVAEVLVGRFCKDEELPQSIQVPASSVLLVLKKMSPLTSIKGTWTTYEVESCCDKLVMNIPGVVDSLFVKVDGEMIGGKNVYKDASINGGFIFWVEKYGLWVLANEYPSEQFAVISKAAFQCPAIQGGWQYNDRGAWVPSPTGHTRCIDCEESPEDKECDICTETFTGFSGDVDWTGSSCQFSFVTDMGYGIELNLNATFTGNCVEEYVDLFIGRYMYGRFCKGISFPPSMRLNTPQVGLVWTGNSSASSLKGDWLAYNASKECACDKIVVQVPEIKIKGEFKKLNGVFWGDKPVYRHDNPIETLFIFYLPSARGWAIGKDYMSDKIASVNTVPFYCVTDLRYGWQYFNPRVGQWVPSVQGSARCAGNCTANPDLPECIYEICGGSYYSPTGGMISSNGGSYCQFLLVTDDGKGIELNLSITAFTGSCEEESLGIFIGDYYYEGFCKDHIGGPPSLRIPSNRVALAWKTNSTEANFNLTWQSYDAAGSCCDKVVMNIPEIGLFQSAFVKTGILSGGRDVYQFGEIFLFWNEVYRFWGLAYSYPTAEIFLQNKANIYCPGELRSGWAFWNSELEGRWSLGSGTARCIACEEYPIFQECGACCDTVTSTSSNPAVLETMADCLGTWSVYLKMPEFNKKKVYIFDKTAAGMDPHCLFSNDNDEWMMGSCANLSDTSNGMVYGNSAPCVNESSDFRVRLNGTLTPDDTFKIFCGLEMKKPPCEMCKTVLDGDMRGLYKLKMENEPRCDDGCLYYKQDRVYCFEDGEYQVQLECPAYTTPPQL